MDKKAMTMTMAFYIQSTLTRSHCHLPLAPPTEKVISAARNAMNKQRAVQRLNRHALRLARENPAKPVARSSD